MSEDKISGSNKYSTYKKISKKYTKSIKGGNPKSCNGLKPKQTCINEGCTWINRGNGYCRSKINKDKNVINMSTYHNLLDKPQNPLNQPIYNDNLSFPKTNLFLTQDMYFNSNNIINMHIWYHRRSGIREPVRYIRRLP